MRLILRLLCLIQAFALAAQPEEAIIDNQAFNAAVVWYNQAREHYDFGEFKEAIATFSQALALNPHNSDYFFGRACSYYEMERYDSAAADILQAIDMEAGQPDYHQRAGNIFFHLNQYTTALHHYTQALSHSAEDVTIDREHCRLNRGVTLLSLKRYAEAVKDFDLLIAENEEYADAWYYRGVAHYHLKKPVESCSDFKKSETLGLPASSEYLLRVCK